MSRKLRISAALFAVLAGCSVESPSASMTTDPASRSPGVGTPAGPAGAPGTAGRAQPGAVATGMSGAPASAAVGGRPAAPVSGQAGAPATSETPPVSGNAGMPGRGPAAGAVAQAGTSGAAGAPGTLPACTVSPITDALRSRYPNMNNPYYTKYADANGVLVGTGAKVDDEALVRYCHLLAEMTSNESVRKAVIADKMWFTMIDSTEQLSSLPQIDKQYGTSLNARARGLGGLTPTICAEDSIMCMPGDKWKGDCICPHETGHTLYSSGIAKVPELSKRLTDITNKTRSSGRISNAYVWMDGDESGMMAWGVQVWYDCAINGTQGAYHPDINTRAELQKELPEFHQFLSELLPADNQYKDCYAAR